MICNKQRMLVREEYVVDFQDLKDKCWSGAINTLEKVEEKGLEDELMDFIECYFSDETPTLTAVNDLLWFDDEMIFEEIGLEDEEDEEE